MTDQLREGTAALLVSSDGQFLFQQRDNLPHLLDSGMISLFGGRREGHESFLECVVREVHEEIGYYLPPERFELLGKYHGPDPSRPNRTLKGEVFIARGVLIECLEITEGCLRVVAPDELQNIRDRLSPSARYALELLFKNERTF